MFMISLQHGCLWSVEIDDRKLFLYVDDNSRHDCMLRRLNQSELVGYVTFNLLLRRQEMLLCVNEMSDVASYGSVVSTYLSL